MHSRGVLIQRRACLVDAIRVFRELTGLNAVISMKSTLHGVDESTVVTPPVHSLCASALRRAKTDAPCEAQWRRHVRNALRTRKAHSHACRMGLRCSCIPIFHGDHLIGAAKLVSTRSTPAERFSLATQALEVVVSGVGQDFRVRALDEEVKTLRRRVTELSMMETNSRTRRGVDGEDAEPPTAHNGELIDQTLTYLAEHYAEPLLALTDVSRAVGMSEKYLTRRFTRVVGQHMHLYVTGLRLARARHLLLATSQSIKEVAFDSGFRRVERFRRVFQEHVGVTPSTYRRVYRRL